MDGREKMDEERCHVRGYSVLAFRGPMRIPVCSHDDVNHVREYRVLAFSGSIMIPICSHDDNNGSLKDHKIRMSNCL